MILIPTREGEQGRFDFKCNQGANFGMTQLLYSDAIVGLPHRFRQEHRPSARDPAVLRLRAEGRDQGRSDRLADSGPRQCGRRRRAGVRPVTGEPRSRRQAPADGRPVQAGDRRRRRSRLPAEHPLRGDLRRVRCGLRDVRGDARVLVAPTARARESRCRPTKHRRSRRMAAVTAACSRCIQSLTRSS